MSFTEHASPPAFEPAKWEGDKILNEPGALKWSGGKPLPAIGDVVKLAVNGCGLGEVVGYFTEDGWLGVKLHLQAPPEWFLKQNKGNVPAFAFGRELGE